jgi:hypothetical protein
VCVVFLVIVFECISVALMEIYFPSEQTEHKLQTGPLAAFGSSKLLAL